MANLKSLRNQKKTATKCFDRKSQVSNATISRPRPKQKISGATWLILPLSLSACNNDNKKILGLAGNAASEGIENLFKESPSVAIAYKINSTTPVSSTGDGSSSLPIEVTGAVVASPTISGYPLLDFTFSATGTVDFSNVSDVGNIAISNSTAAASLTNLSANIEKIYVKETQSGDWSISFSPNSLATLYLDWTNNTGASVDLTSLTLNEVSHLALKNSGNEPITIPLLNLDPEDTQRIEIGNDNDGNIIIGSATNITGATALKTISLTTWNDGDITLGVAGASGLPDVQQLSSIAIDASGTGSITLGDLGGTTPINNLSSIAISTEGAPVSIGSISVKKIDNIFVSGTEFSSITFGNMDIEETISAFTLSGKADITLGTFSGDGAINLNASGMTKKGISLDFSGLNGSVDITTTDQDDTIALGVGSGKVISGSGKDTITVVANAIGNADIRTGDGIDEITLSDLRGIDIVQPGGTRVSTIYGASVNHTEILADKIINFDPSSDKISFGSTTADTNNFTSETGATTFADALSKANTAMGSGKTYYTSYNVAAATDGFSLIFYDSDGNGSSDLCLSLVGITTDVITFDHIVIA